MECIPCTLCFIIEGERVLLGMKKRGFGAGKWNGYGGKVGEGESVVDAARRETYEESGLTITSMEEAGHLRFVYPSRGTTHDASLFRVTSYHGTLIETDEMHSMWFSITEVPYAAMWVDDPLWLPQFLSGKRVTAEFVFDDDATIAHHTVTVR
jgi:8-oxo-dGTP diphosphatase/2-hydroxy-dATP diphosphatase